MPEPDGYLTSRDMFLLVQDLDRKISSLCTQVTYLTERAQEDREAVDAFTADLNTVKNRVNTVCGGAVLLSGALAVWANFHSLFG